MPSPLCIEPLPSTPVYRAISFCLSREQGPRPTVGHAGQVQVRVRRPPGLQAAGLHQRQRTRKVVPERVPNGQVHVQEGQEESRIARHRARTVQGALYRQYETHILDRKRFNLTYIYLSRIACIYTEWFDLDEPCKAGEVESVYVTNIYAARLGKYVCVFYS